MKSYKEICKHINITQKEARFRIEAFNTDIFERRKYKNSFGKSFYEYYYKSVDEEIAYWILINFN